MEAFLAKVAQATKSTPSSAGEPSSPFVNNSSNEIVVRKTSFGEPGKSGARNNQNGVPDPPQPPRNEHGGFGGGFNRGCSSPAVERPRTASRGPNDFTRQRDGGNYSNYDQGPTISITDYLAVAERASAEEIANLESLANSHGTVFEVRNRVARVVIQGFNGLVYMDTETFQSGMSLRGSLRDSVRVGDCMDVVTSTRSVDVRFCTGVTSRSSASKICGDEYAIITHVLENHVGAIALNVTSEKVLILNESLPQDEQMELLDSGNYIDWDNTVVALPKLKEQSWLVIGRTLRVTCIPTPLWLREQLQQFGPGGPCAKLALKIEPYGTELHGKGKVFKLLDVGGVICSDDSNGKSKEIYFSKHLVCKGSEEDWNEMKKLLTPGTEAMFVACQEIPARAYAWRALKLEPADAGSEWATRVKASAHQASATQSSLPISSQKADNSSDPACATQKPKYVLANSRKNSEERLPTLKPGPVPVKETGEPVPSTSIPASVGTPVPENQPEVKKAEVKKRKKLVQVKPREVDNVRPNTAIGTIPDRPNAEAPKEPSPQLPSLRSEEKENSSPSNPATFLTSEAKSTSANEVDYPESIRTAPNPSRSGHVSHLYDLVAAFGTDPLPMQKRENSAFESQSAKKEETKPQETGVDSKSIPNLEKSQETIPNQVNSQNYASSLDQLFGSPNPAPRKSEAGPVPTPKSSSMVDDLLSLGPDISVTDMFDPLAESAQSNAGRSSCQTSGALEELLSLNAKTDK